MKKPIETYRLYLLSNDTEHDYMWFVRACDELWDALESKKSFLVDWLGFEQFSRDLLGSNLTDNEKVTLMKSAVGAFTGRGTI